MPQQMTPNRDRDGWVVTLVVAGCLLHITSWTEPELVLTPAGQAYVDATGAKSLGVCSPGVDHPIAGLRLTPAVGTIAFLDVRSIEFISWQPVPQLLLRPRLPSHEVN